MDVQGGHSQNASFIASAIDSLSVEQKETVHRRAATVASVPLSRYAPSLMRCSNVQELSAEMQWRTKWFALVYQLLQNANLTNRRRQFLPFLFVAQRVQIAMMSRHQPGEIPREERLFHGHASNAECYTLCAAVERKGAALVEAAVAERVRASVFWGALPTVLIDLLASYACGAAMSVPAQLHSEPT
jgi:hypothetical protein